MREQLTMAGGCAGRGGSERVAESESRGVVGPTTGWPDAASRKEIGERYGGSHGYGNTAESAAAVVEELGKARKNVQARIVE